MKCLKKKRKLIRLKCFDYSSPGAYFITICTRNKICYLGRIENEQIILSEIGKIAYEFWAAIPCHFPHVAIDEYVIMPNHLHGILILKDSVVGSSHGMTVNDATHNDLVDQSIMHNHFSKPISGSVSMIIDQFKSSVKRWCNRNGHKYFAWQPRFHDHVIRNQMAFENIRWYVINNPSNWHNDKFRPP